MRPKDSDISVAKAPGRSCPPPVKRILMAEECTIWVDMLELMVQMHAYLPTEIYKRLAARYWPQGFVSSEAQA